MSESTPSKMVEKAREAAKKKNFDYAVTLYLEHLKVTPGDVEARKELRATARERFKLSPPGMLSRAKIATQVRTAAAWPVSKKDPEKTVIQCEDVLALDPNAVSVLVKLGEAASHASLNDVAIYAFEDALTIDPKSNDALRFLGRVYRATSEMDKALRCFEKILKALPQDQEANNMIRDIPAQMTSRKVQEGAAAGKGYRGLIDEDAAKKLEQQSARVRTPEQAIERAKELEREVAANPTDAKMLRLIAELYVKAGDPDKAMAWAEKAIAAKPGDYLSTELKGDLKLKRYEEMIKKLEKALEKQPDDAIKQKRDKAKVEQLAFKIEEFTRRVEAHPTEYGLCFDLGKCLYDAGRVDESITHLQKAKQDPRRKADAGYHLGLCFYKKKIGTLAVKELSAAREDLFEMDGLKKDITYLLGRIYEAGGKGDKAMAEYSSIAEIDYNFRDVTVRMEKLGNGGNAESME